jgi:7,8-dihydropterin-6-yl-methyl-4-(beta-D-ribofuranosyl)aminobenzene 5'-phosphate synthase
MIERLRITVLADNCVAAPDLLAEHGLSMLIEADDRRILFDTGQGRVLHNNLATLGIRFAPLDAIVLSHGHYDHTGGLSAVLEEGGTPAIFVHPAALTRKYAKREQPPHRSIGFPAQSREALDTVRERIVWTRAATEVAPGVWCTGEIPRTRKGEQADSVFFLDEEGHEPDPLLDDQALFVETIHGLVIVAGCAHAGVVNTVNHVCKLAGRNEIHALIGGLHLGRASHKQLEETGNTLGRLNCRILAPCHCTGMSAHAYLRARFHSLVQDVGAGSSLVFDGR